MKALKTALIVFITGVALSFASQAKAEGENTTAILKPWVVVNSNNTVTVFWNQIENVQQYRVCINRECPAKWNEYSPSESSATFPLGSNETKLFWVHAWLTNSASNYNTSGINSEKWADSFKWLTASNFPSATTTIPVTTTTIQANAFSITDVHVEQVKEDVYFNVYLSGQETSSEKFRLLFTSKYTANWKSEKSFENQWIKKV